MNRSFRSSGTRMVLLASLPLAAAVAMGQQAFHYFNAIPVGDAAFRGGVTGICIALTLVLVAVGFAVLHSFSGQVIQVESGRIVMRDANALVSSDWSDVQLSDARRGLAGRQMIVMIAGRPRVVDEFFFPNFDEIRQAIQDRVKTFDRAVRRSMVLNDWVKAG